MFYESEISNLIDEWSKKLQDHSYESPYRDALNDCIYDLNTLFSKAFQEEAKAMDTIEEQEADRYLSSMESHEPIYF
jgi:hypothetical protein